jgi:hypothetical protein
MYATSSMNMYKLPINSLAFLKKTIVSSALIVAFWNPSIALAQYNPEVQQLVQRHQYIKNQLSSVQAQLAIYMLANPQPSAAVLASGAGVAAVIDQNLDAGTKTMIALAGILGIAYCADQANSQYCANVAVNLTNYAIKIDSYNREMSAIERRLKSL